MSARSPFSTNNQTWLGARLSYESHSHSIYREEVPRNISELAVKYKLDADGLLVQDLLEHRDFLAQRLGLPKHLLHVLSWGYGSVVIRYWVLRDVLPLAELALYREDARGRLTQHSVMEVCFAHHPSQEPNLVRCREIVHSSTERCVPLMHPFLLHCRWNSHHKLYIVRETQSTPVMFPASVTIVL